MSVKFSNPRGTADILPSEIPLWNLLENTSRVLFQRYGYQEIRTPLFEDTFLFKRSLGETAEVVNKQLLGLVSGRAEAGNENGKEAPAFSLRPEGTASVVRAYNQYDMGREEFLSKLFYIGPMFRGERPQKGRLRQFHQIGAEAIGRGADHPLLDAEMIVLATHILKVLGLKDFKVYINSLGTSQDKARFALWLREKLKDKILSLNEECRVQYERNVFRLLDSKDPDCQAMIRELNIAGEHLSSGGEQYFREVCSALDAASSRWADDVTKEIKKARYHILTDELTTHAIKYNRKLVGKTMPVLVRGRDRKEGYLSALTEGKIVVRFKSEKTELIGKFVNIEVTSVTPLSIEGALADQLISQSVH